MKEICKKHQQEYNLALIEMTHTYQMEISEVMQDEVDKIIQEALVRNDYSERYIQDILETDCEYKDVKLETLTTKLPIMLTHQIAGYCTNQEAYTVRVKNSIHVLKMFFITLNTLLYEKEIPFRFHHNHSDSIGYWIKLEANKQGGR